jgi:hypothetical protein
VHSTAAENHDARRLFMTISANEITELSGFLVTTIAPFLPHLLRLGKESLKTVGVKAAEEVGKEVGKDGLDLAKHLWSKLSPKLEKSQEATQDMQELARHPDDESLKEMFRGDIGRLLTRDEGLRREIQQLLKQKQVGVRMASADHGSIAISGDVSHSDVGIHGATDGKRQKPEDE